MSDSAKRTTKELTADAEKFVDLLVAYAETFTPEERRKIVANLIEKGRIVDEVLEDMLDRDWLRTWRPDRFDA